MELVIGKKFKFELWEAIVQKMALNEVARFHVDKSVRYDVTPQFPFRIDTHINKIVFL